VFSAVIELRGDLCEKGVLYLTFHVSADRFGHMKDVLHGGINGDGRIVQAQM
jgi:hypothetical protein